MEYSTSLGRFMILSFFSEGLSSLSPTTSLVPSLSFPSTSPSFTASSISNFLTMEKIKKYSYRQLKNCKWPGRMASNNVYGHTPSQFAVNLHYGS